MQEKNREREKCDKEGLSLCRSFDLIPEFKVVSVPFIIITLELLEGFESFNSLS